MVLMQLLGIHSFPFPTMRNHSNSAIMTTTKHTGIKIAFLFTLFAILLMPIINADSLFQNYEVDTGAQWNFAAATYYGDWAQTFIANGTYQITNVSIKYYEHTASGTIFASIYNVTSAGKPDKKIYDLGYRSITAHGGTTDMGWQNFTNTPQTAILTNGTRYALVITSTFGAVQGWAWHNGNTIYSTGGMFNSTNNFTTSLNNSGISGDLRIYAISYSAIPPNVVLTAQDVYTNTSLSNFSVVRQESTYNQTFKTTNGTIVLSPFIDQSGNNYTVTNYGTGIITGYLGNGTAINGIAYVNISFVANDYFTFCTWAKNNNASTSSSYLADFRSNSGVGYIRIFNNAVASSSGTAYVNGATGSSISNLTQWNYICVANVSVTSTKLILGARNNNIELWNGTIDETQLYNRVLSANEINSSYLNQSINYTGRILYLPFENITTATTQTFNLTVNSTDNGGYFEKSVMDRNLSSQPTFSLAQSAITFFAFQKVSGALLLNANFSTAYLLNNTHYMRAQDYNVTGNATGFYGNYTNFTAAPFEISSYFLTGLYSTIFNVSLKNNLTNASLSNFTYFIQSNSYNWNETGTANGTNAYINLINGTYNITLSVDGYSATTYPVTINQSLTVVNQTYYIYAENSVLFYFYNTTTLQLVNNPGSNVITVALTQGSTIVSNTTNTSSLFINNLTPGNYTLTITANGFSNYYSFVQIGNNSFQTFNAYLNPPNSNNAIFSVIDIKTSAAIQGAIVSIETQPFVNQTYVFIGSVATDVTGSFNLNYVQNQNYRLTISKDGYVTKAFNLTPVLYTTYQVQLTPTTLINVTDNYQDVQLQVQPFTATSGLPFNFSYLISAPSGNLQLFNYTIRTNYNSSFLLSGSSNNALGGILTNSFTVINSTYPNQTVILDYSYTLSSGLSFSFQRVIAVNPYPIPSSSIGTGTGGLSLWDRIIIATIVVIFFAGIITWFSNEAFGGVVTIGILGYFIATGFLPLWAGIISIIVLFILIAGLTR